MNFDLFLFLKQLLYLELSKLIPAQKQKWRRCGEVQGSQYRPTNNVFQIVLLSLLLTLNMCHYLFDVFVIGFQQVIRKLSVCGIIRIESLSLRGMEQHITIASRVRFVLLYFSRRLFYFAINTGFLVNLVGLWRYNTKLIVRFNIIVWREIEGKRGGIHNIKGRQFLWGS